ncbi:RICIN domain-containing protein [Microbispora sp. H10830]|uniref:RICIN domain-containing protein n=1 Tax=Microbispora sp. H10830 TaxID=2729109 RepID=UPI001C71ADFD|nr:ricin-type beta-trefoil lectin domain protein [Microbispora sp. H10830]
MMATVAAAVTGAGAVVMTAPAAQAATTTITVNGGSTGRTFDGVGAISGGGGNSRLLIDYPETQRSQILDYLFKPGYGAAVQLLKLEIGGDANSTDGSEPSIEHTRGDINCNVGYEFWLGEQAVARNPNIKLIALPWTAPGWIGGGNFWSQDMINYDISWLNCAKQHGLTISYIGGWNERGHNKTWYENLRSALNSNGYGNVQIVGDDSFGLSTADDMQSDPAFKAAVGVVGSHYLCGYLGDATSCPSSANAVATGKPIWNSEFGSQDYISGSAPYIRSITRGYLDGQMTGFVNWPLVAALYPNLPFNTTALAVANSPWSGSYQLGRSLWANAQVAQFTQPGWRFLTGSASGYLGGNRSNGSYISLKSTNNTDYSTIYETTTSSSTQTVNVNVTGGLNTGTVHVWATNLGSNNPADWFVRQPDITPSNGSYSLTMQPNRIYSVTTTTGQGKGTEAGPARAPLALPYSDDFESYAPRTEAKYFSDMQGSFEVRPCTAGRSGQCLQQVTPQRPIEWQDDSDAFGLVGDPSWSNYKVSVDVDFQQAGTITLLGRANTQQRPQSHQAAYQLRLNSSGAWSISKSTTSGTVSTLTSGSRGSLGTNSWHTVSLSFTGNQISATLDDTALGSVTDGSYYAGQVGLGVVGYQTDMFDNLSVTETSGGNGDSSVGPIRGQASGRCVDVPNSSQTNGTQVALWDCNSGANQTWTLTPSKQLMVYGTKCLDAYGQGTADGTRVDIYDCNGGANQQWTLNSDGTIVGVGSNKCLDAYGAGTANGTQLVIWTCNGGANQKWSRS